MAKAAGTNRVKVPQFETLPGRSKVADGNGAHEEMTKILASQLKMDVSGGGRNVTPRPSASRTGQLKEGEHEVRGEKPNGDATGSKTTNKKKKNKKKSKEGSFAEEPRATARAGGFSEEGPGSQYVGKALKAGMDTKTTQLNSNIGSSPADSSWLPDAAQDAAAGWDEPPPPELVDDAGWHISVGDSNNASPSSNGNWDEPVAAGSSEWDSGWEVAGSRRGKKKAGNDFSGESAGGRAPNPGLFNAKAGGRGLQPSNSAEFSQKGGAKQRNNESEKVATGRGGGRALSHGFQEKGIGRSSPRNAPAPSNYGVAQQLPSQSSWGKPFNKSVSTSSNWDAPGSAGQGASSADGDSSAISVISFGNLPAASDGTPSLSGLSIDAWKGGFPPFSGNGSSVFEDSPASLYSDSQFSDDDLDSDTMSLVSFESEESHKSHSAQKKNKWFRNFFQDLDLLTEEQLHEHDRQWHCPACQGGVGAIDWYRGLQPLLAHAKTVRSKRVKLHKSFAEVLEEEIRIRGAALGTHGSGKYGKWRGLGEDNENKQIVWPPMMVIRNTQLEQDEDEKWIGMGNRELLDLFKRDNPVKARHAYGPQGHRGMSVLIFAESPTGYYNAQRLDTQFFEARRGKDNWNAPGKMLFQPGGDRILYGYIATPEDLAIFNKHSKGKQQLKWELKSFQDMVLSPMRKLDDGHKKVTILQVKVQREQETSRTLKETVSQISKQLEMRDEELQVVRTRALKQHEQQTSELDDMENLYKERIEQLNNEILEKETALAKVHKQYELEQVEQCEKLEEQVSKIPKDSDEQQHEQALLEKEIAKHSQLVEMCIKNEELWEVKKAQLLKEHHQKTMEFKSRQWEELIQFQRNLEQERLEAMETFNFSLAGLSECSN